MVLASNGVVPDGGEIELLEQRVREAGARQAAELAARLSDPAMLEPHRTSRAVITNSAVQVRDPINRSGLGSSAPYARWMASFEAGYRGRPGDAEA